MKNIKTQQQTDSLSPVVKRSAKEDSKRKNVVPINLPDWPQGKRGTPNSFIRSALFAAIRSQDRQYMERQILASQNSITVKYTGMQLNQTDLDVWETIVNKAKEKPLGTHCVFSAHEILKAMALPTGNSQHKLLHATITRLNACSVQIEHDGGLYFGALIKSGAKDKVTKHYGIEINKDLAKLFGPNKWSAL